MPRWISTGANNGNLSRRCAAGDVRAERQSRFSFGFIGNHCLRGRAVQKSAQWKQTFGNENSRRILEAPAGAVEL